MNQKPSICVYCGSRFGTDPAYRTAAHDLGTSLADNDFRLVYGAGDVGLMGEVATATQQAGGDTFGVIPEHLLKKEVGKRDLGAFVVTENMHERKKVMFMNADAIVTIPGGAGSLDELFEVVTWRQIGIHNKPIYLLNVKGYWDPLLTLIDHVIDQGFADPSLRTLFTVKDDVPSLLADIRNTFSQ